MHHLNPQSRPFDIVCLSHLAWEETLFQRPQQLMLRMAQRGGHRVLYAGCVGLRKRIPLRSVGRVGDLTYANISFSPHGGALSSLRQASAQKSLGRLASEAFGSMGVGRNPRILWLYHPGLLDLGLNLAHDAIVYDVMDRFSAFSSSRAGVESQETKTFAAADAIFTGGKSLHAACNELSGDIGDKPFHCLPSGVDLAHFGVARNLSTAIPPDLAKLPHPILGYFGAVDERIDFDLLAQVSRAKPAWSVVLIGPVLSRPDELPPNLHLLGARPYSDLPSYLKGFDVCLLPFRATELVAHISPTKTPEYLAGGRPVVSTAIPDVMKDYGDVIPIARNADDFIDQCSKQIANPSDSASLANEARKRAQTWDQIADRMEAVILDVLAAKPTR